MIQINAVIPAQRTKRGTMKWSVTARELGKSDVTAKFATCGLAVEYGLLLAGLEKWRGLPGRVFVGDEYGSQDCDAAIRALRRRGVEPIR